MIELKRLHVKNPKATLVQVPSMVATLWRLDEGDIIIMELSDDTKTVTLRKATEEDMIGTIGDVSEEERTDSED